MDPKWKLPSKTVSIPLVIVEDAPRPKRVPIKVTTSQTSLANLTETDKKRLKNLLTSLAVSQTQKHALESSLSVSKEHAIHLEKQLEALSFEKESLVKTVTLKQEELNHASQSLTRREFEMETLQSHLNSLETALASLKPLKSLTPPPDPRLDSIHSELKKLSSTLPNLVAKSLEHVTLEHSKKGSTNASTSTSLLAQPDVHPVSHGNHESPIESPIESAHEHREEPVENNSSIQESSHSLEGLLKSLLQKAALEESKEESRLNLSSLLHSLQKSKSKRSRTPTENLRKQVKNLLQRDESHSELSDLLLNLSPLKKRDMGTETSPIPISPIIRQPPKPVSPPRVSSPQRQHRQGCSICQMSEAHCPYCLSDVVISPKRKSFTKPKSHERREPREPRVAFVKNDDSFLFDNDTSMMIPLVDLLTLVDHDSLEPVQKHIHDDIFEVMSALNGF